MIYCGSLRQKFDNYTKELPLLYNLLLPVYDPHGLKEPFIILCDLSVVIQHLKHRFCIGM